MLNFVPNLIPIGSQSHVLITVIKKRISEAGGGEFLDSSITFPAGYYGKHINIFNGKLTSSLFSLEFDLENFIFSLKYHQRKVDRNTSKKSIVFVTILHRNFHLCVAIIYENFIFTQEYAFAERCWSLTFLFEGKFRKYDISVKRKHTKTNEKMIFSVLFTEFFRRKFFFSCSA